MSNQDDIKRLINQHQRRLQFLKEQEASFGFHTPPHISIEIQDIQAQIQKLNKELKQIKGSREPANSYFFHTRPVSSSYFIGREYEIDQILSRLAGPGHDCSAVSGGPRMGKTSLLHHICEPRVHEEWGFSPGKCHFLYLDCHNFVSFSVEDFWRHTLRELQPHMADNRTLSGKIKNLLRQDFDRSDLNFLFDDIAREDHLVVLLLDEFEWILKFLEPDNPSFLNYLRSLLNRQIHGLAFVISTRTPLSKLCSHFDFANTSPFPNCFVEVHLPPFYESEVDKLLKVYRAEFSSDERDCLDHFASTHPYLVQLTGSIITRIRDKRKPIKSEDWSQIEASLEHEAKDYFAEIIDYLDEIDKMLIFCLAISPLSHYLPDDRTRLGNLTKLLSHYGEKIDSLLASGLILNQSDCPIPFSPVFARWYLGYISLSTGDEVLSSWRTYYVDYLTSGQKRIIEDLVSKLNVWPEIVRNPEILARLPIQDELSLPFTTTGQQLMGRYIIEELIGGGGVADVFRAHDPELERSVAIKRLRPILSRAEDRTRFQNEARAIAKLHHPHIIQVYDCGVEENHYYTVMRFVEGRDLKTYLSESRSGQRVLSNQEVLQIIVCVAEALDYAHQLGMIHRDIKPANILLGDDGGVFLSDFGLVSFGQSDLTGTGDILGTPLYMAPEQIANPDKEPEKSVDIYALGSVVYEIFAGRTPFEQNDFPMGILDSDPPFPSSIVPGLPEAIDQVIMQALAKDPAKRPVSASRFAENLRQSL